MIKENTSLEIMHMMFVGAKLKALYIYFDSKLLAPAFCFAQLKPSQNKRGRKNFQLHRFLNTFSQLPAVKKYSKNGAAGKIFGPSYFNLALAHLV